MKNQLVHLSLYIKQVLASKSFLIPFTILIIFLTLVWQLPKIVPLVNQKFLNFKKGAHLRICSQLATGLPQKEVSPEEKSKFRKIAGELPKCGESLKVLDALTDGAVTTNSSAVKIEASGFFTVDCDRAEITLRLVKENQIVWEKKEVDSSCSASEEGKPGGNYTISLVKPSNLPFLEGTELEVCFDLVNKSGERASQNPVSSCEILAFIPYLCQKIPIPNSWR